MIIETIIASVAAITVFGTWLGLDFAKRELHPEEPINKRRAAAIEIMRKAVARETGEGPLRALLATSPEDLPDDLRERAVSFIMNGNFVVPKTTTRRAQS